MLVELVHGHKLSRGEDSEEAEELVSRHGSRKFWTEFGLADHGDSLSPIQTWEFPSFSSALTYHFYLRSTCKVPTCLPTYRYLYNPTCRLGWSYSLLN